jgi:hypothetical protein
LVGKVVDRPIAERQLSPLKLFVLDMFARTQHPLRDPWFLKKRNIVR